MKKIVGKSLLLVICVSLLLSGSVLYAGNGRVTQHGANLNKKDMSKIESVALVSVYGESFVNGRRLQQYKGEYAGLDDFMMEKLNFLKNNALTSNQMPFKFLDEQSVLDSEPYQTIMQDAAKRLDAIYSVNAAALFGKKENEDQELIKARSAYYSPEGYGAYLIDPTKQTIVLGPMAEARERLFKELGCEAIYSIGLRMRVHGFGSNFLGKEKGNVMAEIVAAVELPNGKKIFTVTAQAESDKDTLVQSMGKGLAVDTAVRLSEQAWDLAWNTFNTEVQKAVDKYQKSQP